MFDTDGGVLPGCVLGQAAAHILAPRQPQATCLRVQGCDHILGHIANKDVRHLHLHVISNDITWRANVSSPGTPTARRPRCAQSGSISVSEPSRRSQRVRPSSRRNGTSWLATINAPW